MSNDEKEKIRKLIFDLRKEIEYHDSLYFEKDEPEISDYEYDSKFKELKRLEEKYFHLLSLEEIMASPIEKMAPLKMSLFNKIKHNTPMLSLDKAYEISEIVKFENDVFTKVGKNNKFYVEPKIDGISMALHYENGNLVSALTRGDGKEGEDVIENIYKLKDEIVPKQINYKEKIEIRGEIYLDKNSFLKMNEQIKNEYLLYQEIEKENQLIKQENELRKNQNLSLLKKKKTTKIYRKTEFLNPRNAAAGIIRRKKDGDDKLEKLKAFWYQIIDPEKHQIFYVSDSINFLNKEKFVTNDLGLLLNNSAEIEEHINLIEQKREQLDYEIDGVVIKVNSYDSYNKLGSTSKFPRGAIAYKFYDQVVKSKLKDIVYQVGRTGKIAYVAILEPVNLNGSIVSKAYLHNHQNILNLKIRLNEEVYIKKSGEIIPQVISSVKNFDSTNIEIIKKCPICEFDLLDTDKEQFCINQDCPEIKIQKIIHFFSKNALNVENLSDKTVRQFFEFKLIKDEIDVFFLENQIAKINELNDNEKFNSFKRTSMIKLLSAINNAKKIPFFRFIYALGIKNIGLNFSKILSKKIKSIDQLIDFNYEQLIEIDKFGETMVQELKNYVANPRNIEFLNRLKTINFEFLDNENEYESNILENKSFVITGTLSNPREYYKDIIEKNQGKFSNAISSKVDYLIVGENVGTNKLEKAKKFNIKTITESEFLDLLKKV
ncbi:NAD-dependent DNA ligase LigA [Mesomycoplasma lagogenitalium]|uniref:DNA ligase n=1 Tax=Mesomycoplasma lagogenitalium TaxID=171286 RepID=A0ABY8LUJ7_9BACT|nr:NAD-dependent DNA ligase LigA [Mesomycoplasma lagogenitalium]WGI36907.1 NAD-dependent DNA ligase LigA [Mesomycoplasma lagogenitalium]